MVRGSLNLSEDNCGSFGDALVDYVGDPDSTTDTVREGSEDDWQEQVLHSGFAIDLNEEIHDDVQDRQIKGTKCTSDLKATKTQRTSVQTELRNLHSQWCSLLGSRPKVKAEAKEKKRVPKSTPKKKRPTKRQKSDNPNTNSELNLESKSPSPKQPKKLKPEKKVVKEVVRKPKLEDPDTYAKPKKRLIKKLSMLPENETTCVPVRIPRKGVHSPLSEVAEQLEDPPICTICDDGGDLICCEGPCLRHFHATKGPDKTCRALGLTAEKVKKIDKYYCKNCLMRQHQCFICEELGSSAPSSCGPQEVYLCDAPSCRKFYHAACVARTLVPVLDWAALADRIERGLHGFICPRHSCAVCDSEEPHPGTFVQCRRCPKAWHRDCLTDFSFSGERPTTLIWKHYDREFIYCKEHIILPDIQTPAQDHIRFPD